MKRGRRESLVRMREYLEMLIAAGIILVIMLAGIIVSAVLAKTRPELWIASNVVSDINIMLITTNATLIGLYVTAFIFLNGSLRERVKEDPTIGDAVARIFSFYRGNMVLFAILTIFAIVGELSLNLAVENAVMLSLKDWRWHLFLVFTAVSVIIIVLIIMSSRDITDSDKLICKRCKSNRADYSERIQGLYEKIKAEVNEAENVDNKNGVDDFFSDGMKDGETLLEKLTTVEKRKPNGDIVNNEDGQPEKKYRQYSFAQAYIKAERDELLLKAGKENSASGTRKVVLRDISKSDLKDIFINDAKEFHQKYREYEIELGKIVRLLENMIGKISDNNIDKSIMNSEYKIDSIKNGFLWLYGQDPTKGTTDEQSGSRANTIDVREAKRFLDYVKYRIITHRTFDKRPFNNQEVETIFRRVSMAFDEKSFSEKKALIQNYKEDMRNIIEQFFTGYRYLVGYRDALVHLTRYGDEEELEKDDSKKSNAHNTCKKEAQKKKLWAKYEKNYDMDICIVINYAKILKRVLLDRFVSFVRTDDLSLGNSIMDKSWFNYSELSESNFTHSTFRYSCLEHAIFRHCDLSTCSFIMADASNTDFSRSNFNYSDLTGMELDEANLNKAQLTAVILRDPRIDSYPGMEYLIRNGAKSPNISEEQRKKFKALDEQQGKRLEWEDGFKGKLDKGEGGDKKQAYAEACSKLRKGMAIRDIAPSLLKNDGAIKGLAEKFDQYKQIPGVTILRYDTQTRQTILDDAYDAIHKHIINYLSYHQYSKIDRALFESFDELRTAEAEVRTEKGNSCKVARESEWGKVYFRVANLRHASVNDVVMTATDFSHINMEQASFQNSDLSDADMYYTNAEGVMFSQTNLGNIDAYCSNFTEANFSKAILLNANFVECTLNSANFKEALMLKSIFIGAGAGKEEVKSQDDKASQVQKPKFFLSKLLKDKQYNRDGEELSTMLMRDVEETKGLKEIGSLAEASDGTCMSSDFSNALANDSIFMHMNLMRGRFDGANMSSALLLNDVFFYASMKNTELSNALIYGCSFHQANCSNLILQRAVLFGCEFSNANLQETTFNAALVTRCTFEQTNLSKVNLTRSQVSNCAFVKCNFSGVNLAGTKFKNVIFIDYSFEDAIGLDEAQFEKCSFQNSSGHIEDDSYLYLVKNKKIVVYLCEDEEEATTDTMQNPPRYSSLKEEQEETD